MTNIVETYEHNPEHSAFKNFKSASPAKWETNPAVEEEHMHLSILHQSPRNPAHTDVLQDHTASSQTLNLALVSYNTHGDYLRNKAQTISHAITDNIHPLETEHHVYSGLGDFNPHSILEHSNGVFKAKHFISASIDPDIAMRHDNHKRMLGAGGTSGTDTHVLHFHLPAGYNKGRYIAPLSEFTGEHEFLLDRNQHWKVDNVHTIHGQHHVTGAPLSRTIWSVKPHTPEAAVKEEVEHRIHHYFDDEHPGLSMPDWDKRQYSSHPDHQEFEAHEAYLRSLTNGKTAALPRQDLEKDVYGNDQHRGIATYSKGSEAINDTLVNKAVPDFIANSHKQSTGETIHQTIDRVSKGIRDLNHPLEHTLHVYSGSNHPALRNQSVKEGDIIHTPSFTSTSIKHNIAKGFGWNQVDPKKPETAAHHIIHFELPAGYNKGAYIQPHSWMPHEHEYLLDKDQKWKVKEHAVVKTRDPSGDRYTAIDRHVWTLVPHAEESVHEALIHVPQLFKQRQISVDHKVGISDKYYKHAEDHRKLREEIGAVHHEHLMQTHAFKPTFEEQETVNGYTRGSSSAVNEHLLSSPHDRSDREAQVVASYNMWSKQDHEPDAVTIHDVPDHHNSIKHHDTYAAKLSGVIGKHSVPLDHEAHVYSGIGFDPSEHFKHADGVVHMPAFTSTSLNVQTPMGFGKLFNIETHRDTRDVKPFNVNIAGNNPLSKEDVASAKHVTDITKDEKHIIHFKLPVGYKKGLYIQPHSNYREEHEYLLDKNQKWKLESHEVVPSWNTYRYQTRVGWDSPHIVKSTSIHRTKRHIWTVVPHEDEKPVSESLVHVPQMFARKVMMGDVRPGAGSMNTKHDQMIIQFGEVHHKHLLDNGHAFEPGPGERNDIRHYTEFQSRRLNNHLIHGTSGDETESLNEHASNLSNVIKHHSVPMGHEAHVYSGIGFDPSGHFKQANGVIHMPAFISTSLNYEAPASFGGAHKVTTTHEKRILPNKSDTGGTKELTLNSKMMEKHVIHFKLPPDYKKGLYIAPHSQYPEEHEYLLDKGQKWKLEKHETVKSWLSSRSKEHYPWMAGSGVKGYSSRDKYKTTHHIWTVVPHTDTP